MHRLEKLLGGIDKSSRILEIGPSYNPVARKADGWNVKVVDHGTREELIDKLLTEPVDLTRIEEVDYVWRGGPLHESVPEADRGTFDGCIASHVIEHLPDLVRFLQSLEILLKDNGVVSLAVPDRRFCFDCFRPLTTTGKLLDAYHANATRHTLGDKFDFLAFSARMGPKISWGIGRNDRPTLRFLFADAQQVIEKHQDGPVSPYIDCHAHQFTPSSFRLLILELAALGYIHSQIDRLFPTQDNEFIVQLKKGRVALAGMELQNRRLELMKATQKELRLQSTLALDRRTDWLYLAPAVTTNFARKLTNRAAYFLGLEPAARTQLLSERLSGLHPYLNHFRRTHKRDAPGYVRRLLRAQPVESIPFRIIKEPGELHTKKVALFVTYHPTGEIKRYVEHYLRCLDRAGYAIVLVKIVESLSATSSNNCPDFVTGCLIRENHGFDFAAWAMALKAFPQLYTSRILLFANDSVFGPLDETKLGKILDRMEKSPADITTLTESVQSGPHFQSYFFAVKKTPAARTALRKFWGGVKSIPDKEWVISLYELTQKDRFLKGGCSYEAFYPAGLWKCPQFSDDPFDPHINPTIHLWRHLLDADFPFIKGPLLKGKAPEADTTGWEEIVKQSSYDISLIHDAINEKPA